MFAVVSSVLALAASSSAHWAWPSVNGEPDWNVVRKTDNFETRGPIKDVTSAAMTCYQEAGFVAAPATLPVTAGASVTFLTDNTMYHIGVINIYMAKAPTTAATFDGKGDVWFKIFEVSGVADPAGIQYPTFQQNQPSVTFPIPQNVPSGEYLLRVEHISLHDAQHPNGAQFYVACAQIAVSGGGSGTPSPLVSIPGVYTGTEPGILYDVYRYPTQTEYIQPGPAVWQGGAGSPSAPAPPASPEPSSSPPASPEPAPVPEPSSPSSTSTATPTPSPTSAPSPCRE